MKIPAFETLISSKYFGINKVENHTQRDTLTYANRAQIAYALIKDAIYEKEHPKVDKEVSKREAEEQVNNLVDTLLQDFKNSVSDTERPTMGDAGEISPSYFAFSDANPYGEIMTEEMYIKSQDPATNLFMANIPNTNIPPKEPQNVGEPISSNIQDKPQPSPVQESADTVANNTNNITSRISNAEISINPVYNTDGNMSQFSGDGLENVNPNNNNN